MAKPCKEGEKPVVGQTPSAPPSGAGRSGTAADLQERSELRSRLLGGTGVTGSHDRGRVQRSRCFPLCPSGGDEVRQGAAPGRARCRADGGPEHRLAAQRKAGAVQPRSVRVSDVALTGPPTAAQTAI